MKNFKHILIILTLILATLTFSGCGNGETSYSLDDLQMIIDRNSTQEDLSTAFKIDSDLVTNPNVFVDLNKSVTQIQVKNSSNDPLVYRLSGADKAYFRIDSNGSLYFVKLPYYSPAEDANGDNVYDVTVTVQDGFEIISVDLNIEIVENAQRVRPGIVTKRVSVYENNTSAIQIQASSGTGADINYYLEPGFDESLFTLDETTGKLSFVSTPDFEAPQDGDGDNIYHINVQVVDQTSYANMTTQEVVVEILNIKAPTNLVYGAHISGTIEDINPTIIKVKDGGYISSTTYQIHLNADEVTGYTPLTYYKISGDSDFTISFDGILTIKIKSKTSTTYPIDVKVCAEYDSCNTMQLSVEIYD